MRKVHCGKKNVHIMNNSQAQQSCYDDGWDYTLHKQIKSTKFLFFLNKNWDLCSPLHLTYFLGRRIHVSYQLAHPLIPFQGQSIPSFLFCVSLVSILGRNHGALVVLFSRQYPSIIPYNMQVLIMHTMQFLVYRWMLYFLQCYITSSKTIYDLVSFL